MGKHKAVYERASQKGRIMKPTLTILIVLMLASHADACQRCGIFGLRQCRVQKQVVVKKQAVAYSQPQASQVINIANIAYPTGSTVYGQSSYASVQHVSPALALEHSSRVAERSIGSMQAAIEAIQSNNSGVIELARVQAATQHLQTALATSQQQSSVSLRITQSGGGIDVQRIDDPSAPEHGDRDFPVGPDSLISARCGKCHGGDLSAPKGGLYLVAGEALSASNAIRSLQILDGQDVPEGMRSVVDGLSEADVAGLRREILGLAR